jgi:hypothetical protein
LTVALDLLAEAMRHGVELVPMPTGRIKARALKPPPPDLWARLIAHRSELISALAPTDPVPTAADNGKAISAESWCDLYATRTGHWFHGDRRWQEAEAIAWGELENRWNLACGERVSRDVCAGCRRPIGTATALDLMDGNRVHDHPGHDCLISHGVRWRGAAKEALIVMGLQPPASVDAR